MVKTTKTSFFRTAFSLFANRLLQIDYLMLTFAIGFAIRTFFVVRASFPLNDGGMFYKMTQELIENSFKLPLFTSYNNVNIPFAYPPLGFYVAGIFTKVLNLNLIDVFRFLPLTVTILTIPVFFLLTKELFSKKLATISTFVFTVLPRSFIWLIMGGGMARSFGFIFSLLTLYFATKFFKIQVKKYLYYSVVFMTLTALSHLEWLTFAIYSLVFIGIYLKKMKKRPISIKSVLLILFGTFLLSSPWWFTVWSRFGFEPYINFLKSGSVYKDFVTYPHLITLSFTDEPLLSILGSLGLVGLVLSVAKGSLFLFAWFIAPFLIAPRSSPNLVVVPLTILVAFAINQLYLLLMHGKINYLGKLRYKPKIYGIILKILVSYIAIYLVASCIALSFLSENSYFDSVTNEEKQAMEWIKENTNPSDKFLLITENESWGMDATSEWFPALSDRVNISTPQGQEWLPDDVFYKKVNLYFSLKNCYGKDIFCLQDVVSEENENYDYVFINKSDKEISKITDTIYKSIVNLEGCRLIYENEYVQIFMTNSS